MQGKVCRSFATTKLLYQKKAICQGNMRHFSFFGGMDKEEVRFIR